MARIAALALLLTAALSLSAAGQKAPQPRGKLDPVTAAVQRKQADQLFDAGQTEEAKAIYLPLASSFRDDFKFNERLAYCFYVSRKKEMDKAALFYARAQALNPNDRAVEKNWGKTLSWSKHYPAAIAVFQRILAREPGNRDVMIDLARAQNYAGDPDAARASYENYLKRWPQDREVRVEFAALLSWSKHPDEALENYRAVLKVDPRNANALVGEANVFAWKGQLQEALELYNTILARAPRHYDALRGKAYTLLWLQRYEDAEKVFAQANRLKPADAETQEAMRRIARWRAEGPERRRQAELDVYRRPADAAIARNDLPQAIELLFKALAIAPQDEHLRFRLGEAYLWNQQWTEAIEVFQKLHADHPDNLDSLRELGHAQIGAKQLAEAARTFRTYLERSPDPAVRLDLARVLSWSGQLDDARAAYQEVLAKQPGSFEAGLGLAQVTAWQGRYDDVLQQLNTLLQQKPGNRDALLIKAQVLSWSGRSKDALPILEELRASLPQDREVAYVLDSVQAADRQQESQQRAAAERSLDLEQRIRDSEDALKQNPNDPAILQRLGGLHAENSDFAHSISFYEKALLLRPADMELQLTVARVVSWNRQYPRSVELYRALLAQKPDNRNYRIELARILSWSGHNSESVEQYRELLQHNPDDFEARLGLAQILSWDKRLDESLAEYARILQTDPGNREALLQEARVYSWKGELSTALKLYDDLLIKAPSDRDARLGKAQTLNWYGQPREAKKIIEGIQKNDPENRDVALANASIEASLGRRARALRQLDELDKLQPGNHDSEALRRAIRQDLRATLIAGFTPSSDSDGTRIYASTATLYFNLAPQVRSYVVTNFLPTSNAVSGNEVGREFIFGSSGKVKDWLQLRGEIGVNAATAGSASPIGSAGATIFATDKTQFDFDVARRFINYIPRPIRLDISRVQLRMGWSWRPYHRTSFHVDYFHDRYSDTNINNGANFSVLQNVLRKEHVELEGGYLFAISGFTKSIDSGFFAPTSFQRHAALGNMRIKFAPQTGISFWGSLGREEVFDGPFRLDGTARASWDYKLSQQFKFSLGYGYFAVSSVASTGAYVTHTGYVTFEHVF